MTAQPLKVFVYYNLHKKCFSVKALEGEKKGRVVAHADQIELFDVQFKVSQAGRQRVLKERKKNVHAGAVGQWVAGIEGIGTPALNDAVEVTYNPYKYESFVRRNDETPVHRAAYAKLAGRNIQALI